MAWTEPVTDRTIQDVIDKTAKGYFNVSDWERIYNNVIYLNIITAFLVGRAIDFEALDTPTITTVPDVSDINAFLQNIDDLRRGSGLPAALGLVAVKHDWPGGNAPAPDYNHANIWESVLFIIYGNVIPAAKFRVYCGVANVGQTRFYQHRWRPPDLAFPTDVRRPRTGVAIAGASLTRNNAFRDY